LVASNSESVNTLVLTGASQSMSDVLAVTLPSKLEYSRIHGYDFKSITLNGDLQFERPLQAFEQAKNYDACIWVDADAVITNTNYAIEDFLDGNKPFSASLDWTDVQTISMGNFVIQHTDKTYELFNQFVYFCQNSVHDQDAMNCVLNSNPELINVLPRKYLNAVPSIVKKYRVNEERDIVDPWDDSCFLAHLTTVSNEYRIKIIKENLLTQI